MIIDAVSDLHGYFPQLEGGDLLIVAGNLTARDTAIEHINFYEWCKKQPYSKIVVISGNHDNFVANLKSKYFPPTVYYSHCEYLCDSGTEFEGLKIWGSPWSLKFKGMNPKCMAFTCDTEEELASKFSLIPHDVDILITHSPAHSILDKCNSGNVGSKSLRRIMERVKPKLWVVGHIHEGYGEFKDISLTGIDYHFINASHVNEHYKAVNKPVRVIL